MLTLLNLRGQLAWLPIGLCVWCLATLAPSAFGQAKATATAGKDRPIPVVPFDGHQCSGWAVLVRSDGRWLVSGGRDAGGQPAQLARLWDLSTGKQVLSFERTTDWILSAVVSHDGKWFVTGDGNTAQLFDLSTGKKVRTFEGHTDRIRPVVLSPDGTWLFTAGWDGTVRQWEVATGQQVRVFAGHTSIVHAVALSSDNKTMASAGGDSTRLWDVATGKQLRTLEGMGSGGLSVLLTPDGKWLAIGGCGTCRTLRLWDLTANKEPRAFAVPAPIWSLACNTGSKWLATGGGEPQLWELASGEALPAFRDPAPFGTVHSVALSRDNTCLISASESGQVRVWDVATGKVLCRMSCFRDGTWVAVDAENRYDSPDGKDVEGVTWKVGERQLPLSHFRECYYDPGLLAKHLGWNKEPLRKLTKGKLGYNPTRRDCNADS